MIIVEIPGLPKMANGGHGHWKKAHFEKKKWKEWMGLALLGKLPKKPYARIRCIFTRHSASEPDYDGLVHGFKACRDALVIYGLVEDDKTRNIEAEYRWMKAKPKSGKITIEIFPIEA